MPEPDAALKERQAVGASVTDLNKRRWSRRSSAQVYSDQQGLLTAEAAILDMLREEFRDRPILDIGVGCGRTTPHMLQISGQYLGIDYSPTMIECCRRRYPEVSFRVCDASDLSEFESGAFDLVLFSYNGIDCVGHEDRLKILSEIFRVCSAGGAFVFSAHNLRALGYAANFEIHLRDYLSSVKDLLRYLRRRYYRLKLRRWERREATYALINDPALGGRLLLYYITQENQLKQLQQVGFRDVLMIDTNGTILDKADDEQSSWIYYMARKPSDSGDAAP